MYVNMDDSKNAKFVNMIIDYAMKNKMTLHEINTCIREVEGFYTNNALIFRSLDQD